MRIACRTVMVGLVVLAGRSGVSAERDARTRTVTGRFVRLVERKVGEREYLGVLVRPLDSDDEVVVLVPRRGDLAHVARRLHQLAHGRGRQDQPEPAPGDLPEQRAAGECKLVIETSAKH